MGKRSIAFLVGLLISFGFFLGGILLKQFVETGINGSLLCLYCIGIG